MFWDLTQPARPVRRAVVSTGVERASVVAFSRDMRTVAAAQSGRVTLRDVGDPTRPMTLAAFDVDGVANFATFSPDGKTLAIVTGNNKVTLWNLADRTRPARLVTFAGDSPVAFSPDGRTLAVEHDISMVALWNVSNRSAPARLSVVAGHPIGMGSMVFSPDGRTLATGSHDRTAMLWDVTERTRPHRLTTLTAHDVEVASVAFSPDGRTLATASRYRQTVMLWSIADQADPVRLGSFSLDAQPVNNVNSVVFSPDGRSLAVAGSQSWDTGSAVLWDFTELNNLRADPARQACAITGGGLTADEWSRYIPELPYQRTCPA